jgi:hypothetical protein
MRRILPIGLAVLALAAACVQKKSTRFQHVSHAGKGLDCLRCHEPVSKDATELAQVLPKAKQCSSCHRKPHGKKKYEGECWSCHGVAVDVPHEPDVSRLIFSHRKHLDRNRGQCFPCHNEITVKARGDARVLPSMASCLTCHQTQFDQMQCTYCHENLNVFPIKPVSQFAHQGDFLRIHGQIGRSRPELCAQCHTIQYCTACHDAKTAVFKPSVRWPQAVERSFIHRGDYIGRHMIEARSAGDSCVRCHAQQECVTCHRERGVFAGSKQNPHPPGWVAVPRGMNLHGPAARREIVSCAGCHDQGPASNCVRCHRVGGVGGNPHPPGWRTRQTKTDRMCRICHG